MIVSDDFIFLYFCTMIQYKRIFLTAILLCAAVMMQAQMQWYNPLHQERPVLQGRWWQTEISDSYHRLPDRCIGTVTVGAWQQSMLSSGLSILFRSNSPRIHVRFTTGVGSRQMKHWPTAGCAGMDLYATDKHGTLRWCAGTLQVGDTLRMMYDGLTYQEMNTAYGYEYELFLPLAVEVLSLEIGVEQGTMFKFLPISMEPPIVSYGTSIAMGGCASRPGMSWQNIVRRELGHPQVNLGFSGNGKLEPAVFDMLSEIPAKLYAIDCLPNMTGRKDVVKLTVDGVRILRSKSSAPILLVEHSGYTNETTNASRKAAYEDTNVQLRQAYDSLVNAGVREVYLLTHKEIGLSQDDLVDGVHPSDLGMRRIADAYVRKIRQILHQLQPEETYFLPRIQTRDTYDWRLRHEQELEMARKGDAEIVMIGNSITHFWSGLPRDKWHRGDDSWKSLFGERKVMNMGFGWDRIENILWRIYHGELDGFEAKQIVMMVGTNNFFINTNEEIVKGILQVVEAVRQRQPKAQIYVQAIYPRRNGEERMAQLNAQLQEGLCALADEAIHYINPGKVLLGDDGKVREELFTGDGLHPSESGYRLLAEELRKHLGL